MGCSIIDLKKEESDASKHQDKLRQLYDKIDSNQNEIDNLIKKNHPNIRRDTKNNIIRPDGITLSGKKSWDHGSFYNNCSWDCTQRKL